MAKSQRAKWSSKKSSVKKKPTTTRTMEFSNYFIAALDIMGQGEALEAFPNLPRTQEERDEFERHIRRTFGVVAGQRRLLKSLLRSLGKQPVARRLASKITQQDFDALNSFELQLMSLSDTVFLYGSVANDLRRTPILGLYECFCSCAANAIIMLAMRHPIRGAICIRVACEIGDGEFYGPALQLAHQLENKCVHWPRLLVHESVVEYLEEVHRIANSGSMRDAAMRGFADKCRNFIVEDPVDKKLILDYLGPEARRYMKPEISLDDPILTEDDKAVLMDTSRETRLAELVERGYEFANQELARFIVEGNRQRLVGYYENLCAYYEMHLPEWRAYKPELISE